MKSSLDNEAEQYQFQANIKRLPNSWHIKIILLTVLWTYSYRVLRTDFSPNRGSVVDHIQGRFLTLTAWHQLTIAP